MNELTNEQAIQVLQLRKEGYSIRDVAAELGIKKYQVETILNQHRIFQLPPTSEPEPERPLPYADETPLSDTGSDKQLAQERERLDALQQQIEADRAVLNAKARTLQEQQQTIASQSEAVQAATLQYNRKLRDIHLREQQIASDRRELDSREAKLGSTSGSAGSAGSASKLHDQLRQSERKGVLTERHNLLVKEFVNNCDGCKWSGGEVDDYLERVESMLDKITAFCQENGIDETRLLVYQSLIDLSGTIEQEVERQTSGLFSGSSVRFHAAPEYAEKVRSYLDEPFDTVAPDNF